MAAQIRAAPADKENANIGFRDVTRGELIHEAPNESEFAGTWAVRDSLSTYNY